MIITSDKSLLETYKHVFNALYTDSAYDSVNPKHWREAVACIEIDSKELLTINHVIYDEKRASYNYNIIEIIPELDLQLIQDEEAYYTEKLINSDIVDSVLTALKFDPFSKRLYYSFWRKEFINSTIPCVCVTGCYFKLMEDSRLEIHVHSRANNAYSLLLIDMQFMMGFHKYLASCANLKLGNYYHFFDSIHFFKVDEQRIARQYENLKSFNFK